MNREHETRQRLVAKLRARGHALLAQADRLEQRISVQNLQLIVAVEAAYHVTEERILSDDRKQHVVSARHLVIYFLREIEELSFPEIGAVLNRNHAAVYRGYKQMLWRIAHQPLFAAEIAKLRAQIERKGVEANGQANGAAA